MSRSYAVVWSELEGPVYAGKLELGQSALLLEGAAGRGRLALRKLCYEDLAGVRIGRERVDRLEGRPTVVLEERGGGRLRVASVLGLGVVLELSERLAALTAGLLPA